MDNGSSQKNYQTTVEPTQHHIHWVLEVPSPGVKWLGQEGDHSPPRSVEVKKERSYTYISGHIYIVKFVISIMSRPKG